MRFIRQIQHILFEEFDFFYSIKIPFINTNTDKNLNEYFEFFLLIGYYNLQKAIRFKIDIKFDLIFERLLSSYVVLILSLTSLTLKLVVMKSFRIESE